MAYFVHDVEKFEKDLTRLAKRYPSSVDLVEELFEKIEDGKLEGTPITKLKLKGNKVFKTRLENPDANRGKSGGFRVILYLVTSDNEVFPLTIYSKSDQEDISNKEIMNIINRYI